MFSNVKRLDVLRVYRLVLLQTRATEGPFCLLINRILYQMSSLAQDKILIKK